MSTETTGVESREVRKMKSACAPIKFIAHGLREVSQAMR